MGLHLHITDATGDGLLLEAKRDGGWATYDTRKRAALLGGLNNHVNPNVDRSSSSS